MRVGAVFPQIESGTDPVALRDYAQAVEAMGYTHLVIYDHVLGASTATRPGWTGPYSSESLFHEPFVLFGYLAGLTSTLELVTAVIILPQRQTALVAKQAAEVDLLSGGRLRLGVGVGWNAVEYEGLNEAFGNRGVRSEEQIALLRALWADPVIDFHGRWHTINQAGLNPLPPRRSIPIWIGGYSEVTLKRVAQLGDGWFPWRPLDDELRSQLERLHGYIQAAGRDPASIGLEPQLSLARLPEATWETFVRDWQDLGATHLCINTMGLGHTSLDAHIASLRMIKERLGF
ncbi:LLM class F420-dependent oxidoreductase [Candidatus Chloroploca asiatica]|uniref:LLM class F420-dependent oxidoreductase n=1 Tax=Candidatus Chloroploca asiatica TaxID=1506545 RepID=A0A2H3KHE8_9CHLR|nr:LLM class F420-dependent oxidoreductase [Candidatus Chloroploca asiatica]PDV97194.1 LLM class F420-dependent oxidoreductase [Candidatus Chloroploca asiatica]